SGRMGVAGTRGAPGAPGGLEAGAPGAATVRAPGMLASHYAPVADVRTCEAAEFAEVASHVPAGVLAGLVAPASVPTVPGWIRLAAPSSPAEFARQLYAALRRADDLELGLVIAVLPDPRGGPLALAVRDRLARAAHEGAGPTPRP
ncbi:MAG: Sua5 family C-terminal domain-containing protein, partial [Candidatus Nanopelagicales bacterium]